MHLTFLKHVERPLVEKTTQPGLSTHSIRTYGSCPCCGRRQYARERASFALIQSELAQWYGEHGEEAGRLADALLAQEAIYPVLHGGDLGSNESATPAPIASTIHSDEEETPKKQSLVSAVRVPSR